MPLRDHFRSPLDDKHRWEAMHTTWPAMIVFALREKLPSAYFAEPWIQCGRRQGLELADASDMHDKDAYEVRVYDRRRPDRLVAAVEIVSPSNKDCPESRRAFVANCAGLLREHVSVVIVDIVTTRAANLYAELLDILGCSDPHAESEPLYATTCRTIKNDEKWRLEAWAQALSLGKPLPTMPLWLADDLAIPLDLEKSYEESCTGLGIA